ncbi:hypothetical protein BT69DRAFT_1298280 [Atractiella rhizophila]|nr:hypothetical protein BT69DRAFT_1298280 [Atractiella rhizophila]
MKGNIGIWMSQIRLAAVHSKISVFCVSLGSTAQLMFDLRYLLLLLSQCFGWCFMDADKLTDSLANLAPAEWNKDTSDEWTIVTRIRFTNIKSQLALCDLILQKLNEVGSAIKMTCSDESEKRRLQRDRKLKRLGGGIEQLFRIFKQLQSLFASCYVFWSTVQTNFHHIGSNIVQLTQTQLDAFFRQLGRLWLTVYSAAEREPDDVHELGEIMPTLLYLLDSILQALEWFNDQMQKRWETLPHFRQKWAIFLTELIQQDGINRSGFVRSTDSFAGDMESLRQVLIWAESIWFEGMRYLTNGPFTGLCFLVIYRQLVVNQCIHVTSSCQTLTVVAAEASYKSWFAAYHAICLSTKTRDTCHKHPLRHVIDAVIKDLDKAFILVRRYLSREVRLWYIFNTDFLEPTIGSQNYLSDEELNTMFKIRLATVSKATEDLSRFIDDFEQVVEPAYPDTVMVHNYERRARSTGLR